MMIGSRKAVSPEMNVTPLIDVLLVLLIIFIVILPERHWGEMAQIPQLNTDGRAKNSETPIVIQLKDAGSGNVPDLTLNNNQVSWQGLKPRLQELYRVREDRVAFVQGDPEIEFEYVAQAVDITQQSGALRVALLAKSE
jgi:biopolymer transport protein ExbD